MTIKNKILFLGSAFVFAGVALFFAIFIFHDSELKLNYVLIEEDARTERGASAENSFGISEKDEEKYFEMGEGIELLEGDVLGERLDLGSEYEDEDFEGQEYDLTDFGYNYQEQNFENTFSSVDFNFENNSGSISFENTFSSNFSPEQGSRQNILYSVVKVVDGDTIDVDINGNIERLRLIGMDTPETVDPRKAVQCFGLEASNKAKELLGNKKVWLEKDNTQGERDKYGRLLRYVHIESGTFFNLWMIENGYAHEYTYGTSYKYQAEFKQAELYAKNNQLGLWNPAVCGGETQINSSESQDLKTGNSESQGRFYTSSYHSSKLYYCDTDPAWKNLSEKYLVSYDSEAELLAIYPDKKLNKPCN